MSTIANWYSASSNIPLHSNIIYITIATDVSNEYTVKGVGWEVCVGLDLLYPGRGLRQSITTTTDCNPNPNPKPWLLPRTLWDLFSSHCKVSTSFHLWNWGDVILSTIFINKCRILMLTLILTLILTLT